MYTLEALPILHAVTTYNLAVAWLEKARSEAGTGRAASLKEAAETARRSLQAFEQERLDENAAKARELLEQIEELTRSA